tara:strand:- start:594 stop:833 length:240 start_codon:yes stop_codon:yes gene_type:complete
MSKAIKIYRDGKEFVCLEKRANFLVDTQGYSFSQENKTKAPTKKRKAKVKVDADVIKVDSPFNDGEPINIDDGETNSEE